MVRCDWIRLMDRGSVVTHGRGSKGRSWCFALRMRVQVEPGPGHNEDKEKVEEAGALLAAVLSHLGEDAIDLMAMVGREQPSAGTG